VAPRRVGDIDRQALQRMLVNASKLGEPGMPPTIALPPATARDALQ
jgi:hypothetical protein